MADKKSTTPAPAKAKRKQLTAAERIAKMEAELAATREKLAQSGKQQAAKLDGEIAKLTARRDVLNGKIAKLEEQKASLVGVDSADDSTAG